MHLVLPLTDIPFKILKNLLSVIVLLSEINFIS